MKAVGPVLEVTAHWRMAILHKAMAVGVRGSHSMAGLVITGGFLGAVGAMGLQVFNGTVAGLGVLPGDWPMGKMIFCKNYT